MKIITNTQNRKVRQGGWIPIVAAIIVAGGAIVAAIINHDSGSSTQYDDCQSAWDAANKIIADSGMSAAAKQEAYADAERGYYCCEQDLGYDPDTDQCISPV